MFPIEIIERMKKFFNENFKLSKPPRMDCITTLNHGVRMLYGDMKMKLGSQIDKTMEKLNERGKISDKKIVEFKDAKGKVTTGVTEPVSLTSSIYDTILQMTGNENGCFVFGLSIMDGYHSVTVIVEKTEGDIELFRCDQNEGAVKNNKEELDGYVTDKTVKWWKSNAENGKKMKTRATIWMLKR
jgi:hypothetical protein